MRRAWLRGRDNLKKRYLTHISDYNLGLIMRLSTSFGTPRRWADAKIGVICLRYPIDEQTGLAFGDFVVINGPHRAVILSIEIVMLKT